MVPSILPCSSVVNVQVSSVAEKICLRREITNKSTLYGQVEKTIYGGLKRGSVVLTSFLLFLVLQFGNWTRRGRAHVLGRSLSLVKVILLSPISHFVNCSLEQIRHIKAISDLKRDIFQRVRHC